MLRMPWQSANCSSCSAVVVYSSTSGDTNHMRQNGVVIIGAVKSAPRT
jgi:hypothetical protein